MRTTNAASHPALPNGGYSATTYIDGYLDDPNQLVESSAGGTINIKDDEMLVDLRGTTPQVSDRPINMPLEGKWILPSG
ncbi:MAG: hypothetical protein Ct9H300mP13_5810 [Gammaproteobacteria bacterium]|nr:MAG: hypothetical protein Ct9H300mP13_5810 [Gammaproteobacteria bacterium]